MGMLFEPQYEKWYKDRARDEKIQKRLDYDQYLVKTHYVSRTCSVQRMTSTFFCRSSSIEEARRSRIFRKWA